MTNEELIKLLHRAEAAEDRAATAENGLRDTALFLSGGYNDDGLMDVDKFVKKIKEAIVGDIKPPVYRSRSKNYASQEAQRGYPIENNKNETN